MDELSHPQLDLALESIDQRLETHVLMRIHNDLQVPLLGCQFAHSNKLKDPDDFPTEKIWAKLDLNGRGCVAKDHLMKLADRLLRSINSHSGNVICRSEITKFGSPTQLTEALNILMKRGIIVRIGFGVYAKTRKSSVTGANVPAGSLETLATETLRKMGVLFSAGRAATAYNSGATTQLPGIFAVHTGNRRISRKIEVGGRRLTYENNFQKSTAKCASKPLK